MADNKVNLPGGFGGLTRFSEEYESRFSLKPTQIILFIVLIVVIRVILPVFFPLNS